MPNTMKVAAVPNGWIDHEWQVTAVVAVTLDDSLGGTLDRFGDWCNWPRTLRQNYFQFFLDIDRQVNGGWVNSVARCPMRPLSLPSDSPWLDLFLPSLPVVTPVSKRSELTRGTVESFASATIARIIPKAYHSAAEEAGQRLRKAQANRGDTTPLMPLTEVLDCLADLQHQAGRWVSWLPDNASQQERAAMARVVHCVERHLTGRVVGARVEAVVSFWRDAERLSRQFRDREENLAALIPSLPMDAGLKAKLLSRLRRMRATALKGLLAKHDLWTMLATRCAELQAGTLEREAPLLAAADLHKDAVDAALFHRLHVGVVESNPRDDCQTAPDDFHKYLSAVGQYPALMVALGLAIELRFDGAIHVPTDGRLRVTINDRRNGVDTPSRWTRFERLKVGNSDVLLPASRRIDEPKYSRADRRTIDKGVLDVSEGYSLVTVCAHDAYLKLRSLGSNVGTGRESSLLNVAGDDTPRIQTAGIALLEKNPEARSQFALRELGDDDICFAEDLTSGYRVDAREGSGQWHSLCLRDTVYELFDRDGRHIRSFRPRLTRRLEGFVTHSTLYQKDAPNEAQVSEEVFRWRNWSLAVPLPTATEENTKYDTRQKPLPVLARHSVPSGSLLWQRFGSTYEIRCRAMFLDGSGLTLSECNQFAAPSVKCEFLRQEWIMAPPLLLPDKMDPGASCAEDLTVLAIRSNGGAVRSTENRERIVVPPRVDPALAVHHGYRIRKGVGAFGEYAMNADGSFVSAFEYDHTGEPQRMNDVPTLDRNPVFRKRANPFKHMADQYYPDPMAYELHAWLHWNQGDGDALVGCHTNTELYDDPTDWPGARAVRIRLLGAEPAQTENADLRLIKRGDSWKTVIAEEEDVLAVFLKPGISARLVLAMIPFCGDAGRQGQFPKTRVEGVSVQPGVLQWFSGLASGARFASDREITPRDKEIISCHPLISVPRELELVHAVDRPLLRPEITKLVLDLAPGKASVKVKLDVLIDLPSTGWLAINARFVDLVDEGRSSTKELEVTGPAVASAVSEVATPGIIEDSRSEQIAFHQSPDPAGNWHRNTTVSYADQHALDSTKYREISYSVQGISRYRHFYVDEKNPGLSQDHQYRQEGKQEWRIKALNRGVPTDLEISYAVPIFRWEKSEEHGIRKIVRWGGGLRVYLRRPWYLTGQDEMLGVLLADGQDPVPSVEMLPYITRWGQDPIRTALPVPPVPSFGSFSGYETYSTGIHVPPQTSAGPLGERAPRVTEAPSARATVVGYKPVFPDRSRCFCDVHIDPTGSYYAFISLALARFQPNSIDGFHLSSVTRLDSIQLVPHRWVHLERLDRHTLRVRMYGYTYGSTADIATHGRLPAGSRIKVVVQQRFGGQDELCWLPALDNAGAEIVKWAEPRPWTSLERKPELGVSVKQSDYFSVWETAITMPHCALGVELRVLVQEMESYLAEDLADPATQSPKKWDETKVKIGERITFEADF